MTPVIDAYKRMLDATQQGLASSKDGTSIKKYEKAIDEGQKARKAVDRVRTRAADDEELAEAVQLADHKIEEALVDARVYLSDAYLLRTSYKQAADVVKKGMAQYPKNERLRRANERVVAAANDDDGGWVLTPSPRGRR
jgi:hypothetical protein